MYRHIVYLTVWPVIAVIAMNRVFTAPFYRVILPCCLSLVPSLDGISRTRELQVYSALSPAHLCRTGRYLPPKAADGLGDLSSRRTSSASRHRTASVIAI